MASVTLSSGVVVGHQSLVTNGAYTGYDLTKNGSFPASGYRITGAVLHCTLRNARWDTITVKAADGTTLGSFGAVGTNGERTCALTTGYDYAKLTHITLYGGGVGTQIASGSYVTIAVTWQYTASKLTLSASSVDAGGTVTANISAYDAAFSHRVTLAFGSRSQSWTVAAGVASQAVAVPIGWLDQIPGAASGAGTVTLYTLSGSSTIGQASASLTIRAPQSAAPTFTAACAPLLTVGGITYPSMGSGVYVQSKSGCTAKITGAAAQYGASVAGYSIRGGGYSGSNATLATGLLESSGTLPFVFRVTDSRGLSTEKTVNISVLAYAPPRVSSLTGWRVNSAGSTDPSGTLGKIKGVWSYTTLGGANTCTAKAYIKPAGGSETALSVAMASGSTYWVATSAGNMTLPVTTNYVLRLELTDKYGAVSGTGSLPSAAFAMHLNAAGNSIAFGKACEKSNAVEIAENRTLLFRGTAYDALLGRQPGYATDLDTDTEFGMRRVAGELTANSPDGQWGWVMNLLTSGQANDDSNVLTQIYTNDKINTSLWMRKRYTTGDFSPWVPLATYGVGAIYLSLSATSPASIYGGTWTQIKDRFLVGAGSRNVAGNWGGTEYVTLTADQIPAHTHTVSMARRDGSTVAWSTASAIGRYSGDSGGAAFTMASGYAGGGNYHENRPPYYVVYIWRRTA